MFLSIIIPAFNSEKTIDTLINSIFNQDTHNLKIDVIVINDGSTDDSKTILDDLSKKHSTIKVFHTENQGVYKARNFALTRIIGEYVWMLDADDFISKNAFQLLEQHLEQHLDVVNFGYYLEDQNNLITKKLPPYIKTLIDGIAFLNRNDGRLFLWNNIYNVSFLKQQKITFLAKSVSLEDSLFNIEVFSKAEKVKYINEPLYTYAFEENSISRKKSLEHLMKKGTSSYNVHSNIKKIKNSFKLKSKANKTIQKRLDHSVLGFFFSLIIERYPIGYITKMYSIYTTEGLLPVKMTAIPFKLKCFRYLINHKKIYLNYCKINIFLKGKKYTQNS
jgi:glycosyltransferase involved in cell wall biosynthesis